LALLQHLALRQHLALLQHLANTSTGAKSCSTAFDRDPIVCLERFLPPPRETGFDGQTNFCG
jgi:hypothetical protein